VTSAGDGEYLPGAGHAPRAGPRVAARQLAPHAGELAVVGVGADCGGAVDSLLAGLAWRLGRLDPYQRFQCTTSSKGRRLGRMSGRSGRSAG
jgi:hypothetical protein